MYNEALSRLLAFLPKSNLDYLIDPTFRNINRLFLLSFQSCDYDPFRNSFVEYHMPVVKIKVFNAIIYNQPFFYQPVKVKQKAYEKPVEMWRSNEYATGNLLDYFYHQTYSKLIGIDLSRQMNASIPQQIIFTEKLEEYDGATMFSFLKSSKNLF